MRDAFVRTLICLAQKNKNIELLTGDLGFGVLKPFFETIPNQFTNVGIAEQNMAAMAAGMALEGKTVFIYSIGNFPTLRCLEQIRNDCAYHHANVKIVCIGGGFAYGPLGMSHQATEDIAIMRALPGVVVMCPGDLVEAEEATKAIVQYPGTVYMRLGRDEEKRIHKSIESFRIGKALKIRDVGNSDKAVAVFSTGDILVEASIACRMLGSRGIETEQYSFPTVKPIDKDVILGCASKYAMIVTVEECNTTGSFGGAVSEVVAGAGVAARVLRIGLQDEYCSQVGDRRYLRQQYGLDGMHIAEFVEKAMA